MISDPIRSIIVNTGTPVEAAALWRLELLSVDDIVKLSGQWLMRGLDANSMEVAAIAGETGTDLGVVGPMFERALKELGVSVASIEVAVRIALTLYLSAIVDHKVAPQAGMAAIHNDLFWKFHDHPKTLIEHPNREFAEEGRTYVGEQLGLERLYTWYRELQDTDDESIISYYRNIPVAQRMEKFREHLYEEAEILYKHLVS